MLLTSRDNDGEPRLAEDDPLPPSDRVVSAPSTDLDDLYRRHRSRLLRFFGRAASAEVAQDLCQQLFLRLVGRSASQPIDAPDAYLHRSARNLVANHHRDAGRRPPIDPSAIDPDDIGGFDPAATIEARDTLRRLETAIGRLKPRTREIFLAHRFDGFSYREIAAHTGLSVKAIEKHMSRAIAHIDRLSDRPPLSGPG